jgi:hypothetical protein
MYFVFVLFYVLGSNFCLLKVIFFGHFGYSVSIRFFFCYVIACLVTMMVVGVNICA